MNDRKLTVLTTLAGVLAVGEFGSSIIIWQENRPGSVPLAAVVFGAAVALALAGAVAAAVFDQAGTAVFAETLSFGIAVSAVAVTGTVITLAVPGNRVGWLLLAAAAVAGAVAGLVTRWRRGGPLVRQQLLFLALPACPPVLLFLAVLPTNGVPGWLFGVVLLPLPAAIAAAVLAHGLYDLRHAAQRTLLWLAMSGVVVGVYALVVIAAAALVPGHRTWWLSGVAAAVAALTLIPLREKLQRGVTRVVYGRWHEPYEILAGLGERLEAAADIDRLLTAALAELTTGLDLRDVIVSGPDGDLVAGVAGAVTPAVASPGGSGGREHSAAGLRPHGRHAQLPGARPPAERGRATAGPRPGPAARRRAARPAAPRGPAAGPGAAGAGALDELGRGLPAGCRAADCPGRPGRQRARPW